MPVLLARTGYTGEDGVEILCHDSDAVAVWRLLLSFPEVTPCGLGARDTLRLEMGYPLYGIDMDRTIDPISAGLGWVVSLREGGLHRAAKRSSRIKSDGPALRLVGTDGAGGRPAARLPRVARRRGGR